MATRTQETFLFHAANANRVVWTALTIALLGACVAPWFFLTTKALQNPTTVECVIAFTLVCLIASTALGISRAAPVCVQGSGNHFKVIALVFGFPITRLNWIDVLGVRLVRISYPHKHGSRVHIAVLIRRRRKRAVRIIADDMTCSETRKLYEWCQKSLSVSCLDLTGRHLFKA